MSRRTFLGISAGAAAVLTASYAIKWPKISFSPAQDDYEEGVLTEKWVATSCLNCPTRCAVNVRVVNGKAVRIIGNPKSTYSDGKACPRSHIGLQVLYNPERIQQPLRRNAGTPKGRDKEPEWEPISWEEALGDIATRLEAVSDDPGKLLLIQGLNTTSDGDLIRRFAKAYGTPNHISEENLELDADTAGKVLADGRNDSGYDLGNTNYVLAFGANIVESERPLARNLRMWGKIRRERPNRARVVVIDPRYSVTAAKADEWIPIKPGTEGALAMAIAYVIIDEGLYDETFIDNWTSGLDAYKDLVLDRFSPDGVAELTGIDADVIRRIAREFAQFKPAIAWSGMGATSWPHGTYASHAIFCLNALVGGIDARGGILYQESPTYEDMPALAGTDPGISLRQAAEGLSAMDTVIGFNSNLIMSVPETSKWDEALAQVPFYVHVGPAWNEMARYADIVLPACTYLEEWAYESALPGSGYAEAKIKQPVVEPLYDSRPTAQVIFGLASQLGAPVKDAFENIGDDPEGFVRFRTAPLVSWDTLKADGVWKGQDYQYGKYDEVFQTPSGKFEFHTANLDKVLDSEAGFVGDASEYDLKLVTYHPVLDIRNGNQNYPWAQEMLLVMHGYGWKNFVEINAQTADELGIGDGDKAWVESDVGRIKAKARVFEGIRPGVVAIALGQGHYACGEWADGIGVNPNEIIRLDYDTESGQASFLNTRVKVYKA
ncbi:MAG: molybdopterin-dependent oxidoreductase [Dehalococcoidia bacterium]|nr:molybdopterin-dependent oxidoreductase [Dehalococcoidia bacterium]